MPNWLITAQVKILSSLDVIYVATLMSAQFGMAVLQASYSTEHSDQCEDKP